MNSAKMPFHEIFDIIIVFTIFINYLLTVIKKVFIQFKVIKTT